MKYTKPSLTVESQADLLVSRGLIADRNVLIRVLTDVSYYRFSGYLFPYRTADQDSFQPGTRLEQVYDQYLFDRQLRVLVMDALERVEVSVKSRMVNLLTSKYGAFAHSIRAHFPDMPVEEHRRLLEKIHAYTDRSKEAFIRHYVKTYTSETEVPLWIAVEIMDFGAMLTLYRYCAQYDKRTIAEEYGVSAKVLESWLFSLNVIRNTCAHHGRLWNKIFAVPPLIPAAKHRPEFHVPSPIRNDRIFAILSILKYFIGLVAPNSNWSERAAQLWTVRHPEIPLRWMGIPENWREYGVWCSK